MKYLAPLTMLTLLLVLPPTGADDGDGDDEGRNLFEWTAVAPTVVAGTSLGENGRYVEIRVIESLYGAASPGDVLRVDLKFANRSRDRTVHRKSIRLGNGVDYVLLLEEWSRGGSTPFYRIVRGVNGARELPLEGREAYLDAVRRFLKIHDTDSDEQAWEMLAGFLEESNPILLQTALEQFTKFLRGHPGLTPGLVPLLDHPRPSIRVETTELIGQIIRRYWGEETIPAEETIRAELIARATRDESVEVRVEATKALAAYPDDLVGDVLDHIAGSDPEQKVRYTAALIRLDRKRSSSGRAD